MGGGGVSNLPTPQQMSATCLLDFPVECSSQPPPELISIIAASPSFSAHPSIKYNAHDKCWCLTLIPGVSAEESVHPAAEQMADVAVNYSLLVVCEVKSFTV